MELLRDGHGSSRGCAADGLGLLEDALDELPDVRARRDAGAVHVDQVLPAPPRVDESLLLMRIRALVNQLCMIMHRGSCLAVGADEGALSGVVHVVHLEGVLRPEGRLADVAVDHEAPVVHLQIWDDDDVG